MADLGTRINTIAAEVAAEFMQALQQEFSRDLAQKIEARLRREMSGDRTYMPRESTASRKAMHDKVRRMFNGSNATEIARELGIGRTTVYRILKQPG